MKKRRNNRVIAFVLSMVMICSTLFSNGLIVAAASTANEGVFQETFLDDLVRIKVSADANIVPDGATMVVEPVLHNAIPEDAAEEDAYKIQAMNELYNSTQTKLDELAKAEQSKVEQFRAYHISFEITKGDMDQIEKMGLNDKIKVDMEYSTPADISSHIQARVERMEDTSVVAVSWNLDDTAGEPEKVHPENIAKSEEAITEEAQALAGDDSEEVDAVAVQEETATVETVSTKDKITLNLFDYTARQDDDENVLLNDKNIHTNEMINKDRALKFRTGADDNDKFNKYKNGELSEGLVETSLTEDGYPVLTNSEQEPLDYLFNPDIEVEDEGVAAKLSFPDLDNLFTKDADGYYVYDSTNNYSFLPQDSSEFTVYDSSKTGFFPFTQYSNATNSVPSNSVPLRYDGINHYFGMSMEAEFIQPKNGNLNGNPMVFEFSGDDDVWVFIDDVLVLDIGGIHDNLSGRIDFSTGEVTRSAASSTNIKTQFNAAGKADALNAKGIFGDYSTHTIKFFYLERGNYDSNCSLKFNLPVVDKKSVFVGKAIEGVNPELYKDVSFDFKMEVGGSSANGLKSYGNQVYKIYNINMEDTGMTGTTDKEGVFSLKHNEVAVFDSIGADQYYRATELNLKSQEFNEVKVNDIIVSSFEEDSSQDTVITGNEDNKEYLAKSEISSADKTRGLIFKNHCSAYNNRNLTISKQMTDDTDSVDGRQFDFTINLNEKPYTGEYTVGDKSYTADDGMITLAAGQEAVITSLPAGTAFTVTEDKTKLKGFAEPVYQVADADDKDTKEKAAGSILLGKDPKVTVTNKKYTEDEILEKSLSHDKTAKVLDWDERTYEIALTAHSKISNTEIEDVTPPVDVMMTLDVSGSMLETFDGSRPKDVTENKFSKISSSMDTSRIYYWKKVFYGFWGVDYTKMVQYNSSIGKWQYANQTAGSVQWLDCTPDMIIYDDTITRMSGLKDAAAQYIKMASQKAVAGSRTGMVGFENQTYQYTGDTLVDAENENALMNSLQSVNLVFGYTDMGLGMQSALKVLEKNKSDNPQYMILLSDGEPNVPEEEDHGMQAAKDMADKLRAKGIKVFTVAIGEANAEWLRENIAFQANDTYALSAENAAELSILFERILSTVTHTKDITGATVKDVIDSRFQLMDNGKVITDEMIKAAVAENHLGYELNGGYVSLDEKGNQVIRWVDQTLPYRKESEEWKKVIQVKAKENFIGGNNITTNGAESGIEAPAIGETKFEQPTVNVKVRFDVNNGEDVIFWGDTIASGLTDTYIKQNLFDGNSVKYKDTVFLNVSDKDFEIKWYKDAECKEPVELSELRSSEQEGTYYMKVFFKGTDASSEESLLNTDNKQVTVENSSNVCTYTVHVIKGQLTVTKEIDQKYTNIQKLNSKQSFVFRIDRREKPGGDINDSYYMTLMFDANTGVKEVSETISGLKKGYYTITEQTEWSSKYGAPIISDNYKDGSQGKDIYIGEKLSSKEDGKDAKSDFYGTEASDEYQKYAPAHTATVNFLNEIKTKEAWSWLGDVASAVNEFVK